MESDKLSISGQAALTRQRSENAYVAVIARSHESLSTTFKTEIEDFFSEPVQYLSPAKAAAAFSEEEPALIFFVLEDQQSFTRLSRLQAAFAQLPFIAVVPHEDVNAALRAMRDGAADFLSLDSTPLNEQLAAVSRRVKRRFRVQRAGRALDSDMFLGTSHDLKGPLGVILTSAQLLNTLPEDQERSKQLMTCIESSARGAINLIESIASVRRIDDGALVLTKTWLSVEDVLTGLYEEYRVVAEAHHVSLEIGPVDPALEVFADRVSLMRIMANLIQNAIKYTPEYGSVRLTVRKSRGSIDLSVLDTGRGIAKADAERIFERYSRLADHSHLNGTGIGLYVSKALVEAHGGRIKVRSRAGQGSVFTVSLPLPV